MTECARCGDCCENIYLNRTKEEIRQKLRDDPDGTPSGRFILRHFHRARSQGSGSGRVLWSCDRFDPETRLCTAHDDRPPLCANYPWYGGDAISGLPAGGDRLPPRCSFWADLPADQRPDGWVPLALMVKP